MILVINFASFKGTIINDIRKIIDQLIVDFIINFN